MLWVGLFVACAAWRFKQFERERTKLRSREEGVSVIFVPGFSRLWCWFLRLPLFLHALKLLKNRQATQARLFEKRSTLTDGTKYEIFWYKHVLHFLCVV